MTAIIADEQKATFARRRTASRRYGDPEEVAHATLSLLLPAASYITGAVLVVDGGLTIRTPERPTTLVDMVVAGQELPTTALTTATGEAVSYTTMSRNPSP
jgi:hypothetical protein